MILKMQLFIEENEKPPPLADVMEFVMWVKFLFDYWGFRVGEVADLTDDELLREVRDMAATSPVSESELLTDRYIFHNGTNLN